MNDHKPHSPDSEPACFVGSTLVLTTQGRHRIDNLAVLAANRARAAEQSNAQLAQLQQASAGLLAQYDASATLLLGLLSSELSEPLQASLLATKEALADSHEQQLTEAQAQLEGQLAAMMPKVLTRDPDTGEIVERAIVNVWQAKTATALVDVVIDSKIVVIDNAEQEQLVRVRCTPEHEFIGPQGGEQAHALQGVKIYRASEQGAEVDWQVLEAQVYEAPDPVAVYDLEVEGIAAFFVAPSNECCAALVHNCSHTLKVGRRFSHKSTLYEQRDVTVDYSTGKKLSCRVPVLWSDNAAGVLMSKYAVRTGVPDHLGGVDGREVDAEHIFDRLVTGWREAARANGYWARPEFDTYSEDDKQIYNFCAELKAMLEQQIAAPNSPQWFNTGVSEVYGIKAGSDGHFKATERAQAMTVLPCVDSLEYPQISACFIQSVKDNLVGEGGIMDLWTREARLFKYGSGSGANYSALRGKGEPLSRGGVSSGLLSFLRVGDVSAGAIKSAGTTRRAARMVIVDDDHPDVLDFIGWKSNEDDKIRALHAAGFGDPSSFEDEATETVSGQNANNSVAVTGAFMSAVDSGASWDLHARVDGSVTQTVDAQGMWEHIAEAAWKCADPGLQFKDTINKWHTCKADGLIRGSNPCQPAHAKVLTPDGIRTFADIDVGSIIWSGKRWTPVVRKVATGIKQVYEYSTSIGSFVGTAQHQVFAFGKRVEVQHAEGIDQCPLPGVDLPLATMAIINERKDLGAMPVFDIEVEAEEHSYWTDGLLVSNCSEYIFLDDTACNLASLNLAKFYRPDLPGERCFDWDGFAHACRLWTIVLDISVSMAGYPTAEIARRSMLYRTLGLGYAALGELLVLKGLGYGTVEGRHFAAEITSLMTAVAYNTSTELAAKLGPFPRYDANACDVMTVLELHASHADSNTLHLWRTVIKNAKERGVRNAQVTLLAPTGTIGIEMDCETTGVEPYFSDTIFKQLSGGGTMRMSQQRFTESLLNHGYVPGTHTREAWTVEDGIVRAYKWVDVPAELEHVLICADVLTPEQHIDMMAAVQPSLSGAISKTINMPASSTVEDVASLHHYAWTSGLKSVAVYRDGCKPSQPLQGRKPKDGVRVYDSRELAENELTLQAVDAGKFEGTTRAEVEQFINEVADSAPGEARRLVMRPGAPDPGVSFTYESTVEGGTQEEVERAIWDNTALKGIHARGERIDPPDDTDARRFKLELGGHTFYLICGEHKDGSLAEVFIVSPRTGSSISGWVNAWAKTFSLALQHGTPLAVLVDAVQGMNFEPAGFHKGRPVSSAVDAFARVIGEHYLSETAATETGPVEVTREAGRDGETVLRSAKTTGQSCTLCGSFDLRRSGSCYVCGECGETTGCS